MLIIQQNQVLVAVCKQNVDCYARRARQQTKTNETKRRKEKNEPQPTRKTSSNVQPMAETYIRSMLFFMKKIKQQNMG